MVELKDLHCIKQSLPPGEQNRPLAELDVMDHIHGCLIIRPDGKNAIHNFGYWNPSDACIGEWITVFMRMNKQIESGGDFTFEYPYPDQGDPQLQFIFTGATVTVRTTYYTDDSWSQIEEQTEQSADRASFEQCVDGALSMIQETILEANPTVGAEWLKRQRGG